MKQTLTLVTLASNDLQRSLAFYRDGLGWTPHFVNDDVAFFQMNGIVFSLLSKSVLEEDFGGKVQMGGKSIGLAHNVPSRDEVDATLAKISNVNGGAVIFQPIERVWGGYSGYFEDPDGHLWEVAWNPQWTVSPQGYVSMGA